MLLPQSVRVHSDIDSLDDIGDLPASRSRALAVQPGQVFHGFVWRIAERLATG